ncbi:MAG: DNA-directed RNA polymerase subunit E'' [Candidatus Nanoarchaeia archaeon]|nr:DNA-directed RNA polymerase subunit E'' [Candidatus Nanoarchaeia archaeon]
MKRVCRKCKIFVTGDKCPLCHGSELSDNWQGKLCILDPIKSDIAKKLKITAKGEYAIKIR